MLKERNVENQGQLLETVASTLSAAGMHDKAGEFYEEMNQLQRAMDRFSTQVGTLLVRAGLETDCRGKAVGRGGGRRMSAIFFFACFVGGVRALQTWQSNRLCLR